MGDTDEVVDEVQAAMALTLMTNVRNLIREEIKAALDDYNFVCSVNMWPLSQRLFNGAGSNIDFSNAVKNVLLTQLNKY